MSLKERMAAFENKKEPAVDRPKPTPSKLRMTDSSAKLNSVGGAPSSSRDEEASPVASAKSPDWKSKLLAKKDSTRGGVDGGEPKVVSATEQTGSKVGSGGGAQPGKRAGGGKGIAKFLQKAKEVQTMAAVSKSGFRSGGSSGGGGGGGGGSYRRQQSGGQQQQQQQQQKQQDPPPTREQGAEGGEATSGQTDAMEAIRLAREAMGASAPPSADGSNHAGVPSSASPAGTQQQQPSGGVSALSRAAGGSSDGGETDDGPIELSEGESTVVFSPPAGGVEDEGVDHSARPPAGGGLVRRVSLRIEEEEEQQRSATQPALADTLGSKQGQAESVSSLLESPAMAPPKAAAPPSKPTSRFKGAAMKVKAASSFSHQGSTDPSAMDQSEEFDMSPERLSPSKVKNAFRPNLKAGQQAMREIERKQWLARKWQEDIDKQRQDVKSAMEHAQGEKTGDMAVAMDKLRSIMNPLAPSPDQLAVLETKADGLLTRIKDQLAAAATGGGDEGGGVDAYGDGGGESGHYGDEEDDDAFTTFRKKHAGRGKELISRIISKEPPAYSGDHLSSDDVSGGNGVDGGSGDYRHSSNDGGNDGDEDSRQASLMEWGGAMTVERLADDAEDLAMSRGMSGQRASFASLCAVLVVDGIGNVATAGWEEKFISLSDAKLWSAAYFSVDGGTISTAGAAGRFNCIADLRSPGVSVVFEESSHTSTGFAIVIRTLSTFTIKIAPKRFKALLEWGAVLHQAINELPTLVPPPLVAHYQPLPPSSPLLGPRAANSEYSPPSSRTFAYGDEAGRVRTGGVGSSAGRKEVPPMVPAESWVETYRRRQRSGGRRS